MPINNGGGASGITVELDPNSLPLIGGTLTGNLIIDTGAGSAGYYETTEMYVERTDANIGAGESNAYGALYNGGLQVGDIDGKYAELTPNRLRLGNTTSLEKGSFDSGRNGNFGISLICHDNVELNWQSGYLKAKYNGSFVPINVESDIVLSKYVETGEDLPPAHTITTTISLNGGISCNANDDWNDHSFNLNQGGVGGVESGDYTWGLNPEGVGGEDGDNSFGFSPTSVGGQTNNNTYNFGVSASGAGGYNDAQTWGIGVFSAGGDNDDRASWNVGYVGYSAQNEYNTCSLNSLGVQGYDDNEGGSWSFGINGLTFSNGVAVNSPSAGNSGLSQSGNIAHSDYPKEIRLVINGVTYAIPARIVT